MGKKQINKKQLSKNEALDKTVDLKLGKWREKSIAMEEERRRKEEERKNKGKWKCLAEDLKTFIQTQPKLFFTCAAGAVLMVIIAAVVITSFMGKVNPEKYITISYTGANGYAAAECSIDTEKFYEKLAGKEKDVDRQENLRSLAESLTAKVQQTDISNNQKITVEVSYDKKLAKELGVKVKEKPYTVQAQGISEGTELDLFANVKLTFAGISPDAYAVISNDWGDEYLGMLTFTADKTENIEKGDEITVRCETNAEQFARRGYRVKQTEVTVRADDLSVYAQTDKDLDEQVISDIKEEITETIIQQTQDTTFRMLYKATSDTEYLRSSNTEEVSEIECLEVYFLKKNDTADDDTDEEQETQHDNYMCFLYQALIENDEEQETVYFGFMYSDGYIKSDGQFNIVHNSNDKRYICSDDYDAIYEEFVGQRETRYELWQVQ